MLRRGAEFWEKEAEAPLMNLNYGYLQKEGDAIFDRVSKWPAMLGVDVPEKPLDLTTTEKPDRIYVADAERTFVDPENRQSFVRVLQYLGNQFKDYAQGLGFVTSFFLLTMPETTAITMLEHLNSNEKFVPGYWKTQAVSYGTDAYVFEHLMNIHFPKVAEHLRKNFIAPNTYCSKWFVSLNVHVLPFEALFDFYEKFFEGGFRYLMQFGLSLISHLQQQILEAKDPGTLFAFLRFDPKYVKDHQKLALQIVEDAEKFDVSDVDFDQLRKTMYETHLKQRMEEAERRAREAAEEDEDSEELLSSDEEDEDGDDGTECQICNNNMPEYYCEDCDKQICEMCHTKNRQGHNKTVHKTIPVAEYLEKKGNKDDDDDDEE
eukprot:GEZU01021984.1.p1 GENE.GEZU01021984.1~~GEZU01021984.1.p1  ORF type:complete len:376 (+),score=142.87 GEZU01021984.1:57-1184(+)